MLSRSSRVFLLLCVCAAAVTHFRLSFRKWKLDAQPTPFLREIQVICSVNGLLESGPSLFTCFGVLFWFGYASIYAGRSWRLCRVGRKTHCRLIFHACPPLALEGNTPPNYLPEQQPQQQGISFSTLPPLCIFYLGGHIDNRLLRLL